jgi:hypothetical protein
MTIASDLYIYTFGGVRAIRPTCAPGYLRLRCLLWSYAMRQHHGPLLDLTQSNKEGLLQGL